jgi:hypothetical protein
MWLRNHGESVDAVQGCNELKLRVQDNFLSSKGRNTFTFPRVLEGNFESTYNSQASLI